MFKFPEKPRIDDIWWGQGDPSKTDTSIRPFKIDISNDVSIAINIKSLSERKLLVIKDQKM